MIAVFHVTFGIIFTGILIAPASAQTGVRQQTGNAALTHIAREANNQLEPKVRAQKDQFVEADQLIDQIYEQLREKYALSATPLVIPARQQQLETPREE